MGRPNDRTLPIDFVYSQAGFSRSEWFLVIPRKFTWEDVLDPTLWARTTRLKEHDEVTVVGEAGNFDCTLRVISAFTGGVLFRVLRTWFADTEPAHGEVGEAYVALSPGQGWVLYNSLGLPVARYGSEDAARQALAELPAAPPPEQVAA